MLQIVYVSAARSPFTEAALQGLLERARVRNRLYDVTGLLLYHEDCFLQILEGPASGVETIFASIARDPRHTNTRILHRGRVGVREFAAWSMAYLDSAAWPQHTEGRTGYRDAGSRLALSTPAGRYVSLFRNGLCRVPGGTPG